MTVTTATGVAVALHTKGNKPPEWVHLAPAGTFKGQDGRGPYTVDAAAVVAASQAGLPLVLDFMHSTHLGGAAQGSPAPAAAWIVALEARADGVWGKVDWTPGGRAAVLDRSYRYISPVMNHAKETGVVQSVIGAALTNAPNLSTLTALHAKTPSAPMNDAAPPDLARLSRMAADETEGAEQAIFAACNLPPPANKGT